MGPLVAGTLRSIRPLADGDTIYYRWLDFDIDYGIHQAIFDSSVMDAEMKVGGHYNMLLSIFPLHYSPERLDASNTWSAQIIDLHWHLPFSSFAHVSHYLAPSVDSDYILLEAPFGQVMTSYESIKRKTGVLYEQLSLGAFISWEKDIRISLAAVV